jgi:hypothetical protein
MSREAKIFLVVALVTGLWAFTISSHAQDKPANNMESVHEKLKADKKLIITKYMELTEAEAKNFWPVYEEYQNDLQKIDQRLLNLLQSYAADYRNQCSPTKRRSSSLMSGSLSTNDDAKRRAVCSKGDESVAKKAALPADRNKYRILMKYDLAVTCRWFNRNEGRMTSRGRMTGGECRGRGRSVISCQ